MAVVLLDAEVVGPDLVALSLSLVTTSSMAMRAVNKRNVNKNKGFVFYKYDEIY